MEVGYSEAFDFLRLDAKWWLINSAGNTRFVMIVQFMTDPFAIHIECWAMVSVRNGLGARAAPRGNCQEDWTGPDDNFYSVLSWDILGLQG